MTLTRRLAVLAAAALSIAAAPPARQNWNVAVAVTPSGSHVIGNPKAKVKLTEYISYTCPHCAHFETEASDAIRMAWIVPGKLSVEIRHFVRDPVDLTVAMLTNCGAPSRFAGNHTMFLRRQATWIKLMASASPAQRQRWTSGDNNSRRRAIAADFQFQRMMEQRGYSRIEVDRCLTDEAMARRLAEQTRQAAQDGVSGTPSFALDGILLTGTHSWDALKPQISARL